MPMPDPRTHAGRLAGAAALLLICAGKALGAAAGPVPPTVAGTNLCADLLLARLADPAQIRSLSAQSRDPGLSPIAATARAYPANRGGVEGMLYLRPDIALVYQGWTGRRHARLLAGQGIEIVEIPYPTTWEDALRTVRAVAARIGRAEAAEERIAQARRRMASLGARMGPHRTLYLRPNGGTAGSGTYVDDLFRLLGLRNLAAEEGLAGWGRFPMERLALAPPDLFVLGYFDQAMPPAESAYGRHPLPRTLLSRIPTVRVPADRWGCGGLELVEAAESLVAQIERLEPPPRP